MVFVARLESVQDRTFTLSADATHGDNKVATAITEFTTVDFEWLPEPEREG